MATSMSYILPPDEDKAALKVDTNWRIIFSVQIILYVITLVLFLLFCNIETPKFFIMNGLDDEARESIRKIYLTNGDERMVSNILNLIKSTCTNDSAKVSMVDALFKDERYTRSSWVSMLIMMFACLTGYYAIIAFSNTLLEGISSGGEEKGLSVRTGTVLIAAFNFLGAIVVIYLITVVGRRKILLGGQLGIALFLVGVAVAVQFSLDSVELVLICGVAFFF